ncbi:Flp pilus assembly protein CpaB [Candidatus Liberibacter solanacearum]|uniref:Flp pilus assembly protein CpaB n=1 Tax=Candidatus Liberibacter solanacearum TaxID=556287 RepID=A0A1V2N8R0_9HYPH|nr:Flp pilus assembly protein CpaB [Candidatus Liberibacter solanacearum]ONI59834.1 Flp pilus assembly protein CpaB [Candidatus Liberibacter solanacearum]ONI60064.1 Flp pilus assembly protein CpaB [Candidatus Liberibacter solanacearum]
MKLTRLMGLIVSGLFALLAGIIAMRLVSHHHLQKEEIVAQPSIRLSNVLMAKSNLKVGMVITPDALEWVAFPAENVVVGFVDDVSRPNAIEELKGSIVRIPILKGDPIRFEKLVDHGQHGVSSLLSKGKRAVALDISVSNAVGGLVKPNDHVDVLMVRLIGQGDTQGKTKTDVVLSNVRVLAIDQTLDAEGEQNGLIGNTATLELTPVQAKTLIAAQHIALKLTLVLRSIADFYSTDLEIADFNVGEDEGRGIQVIKSGIISNKDGEEMLR